MLICLYDAIEPTNSISALKRKSNSRNPLNDEEMLGIVSELAEVIICLVRSQENTGKNPFAKDAAKDHQRKFQDLLEILVSNLGQAPAPFQGMETYEYLFHLGLVSAAKYDPSNYYKRYFERGLLECYYFYKCRQRGITLLGIIRKHVKTL